MTLPAPRTGADPNDAHSATGVRIPTDQDVYAGLRRHLVQAEGTPALYEQLRLRANDHRADLVRAHDVGPEGACRTCGGGTAGATTLPCHPIAELAHELGLHLRRILPATDTLIKA